MSVDEDSAMAPPCTLIFSSGERLDWMEYRDEVENLRAEVFSEAFESDESDSDSEDKERLKNFIVFLLNNIIRI